MTKKQFMEELRSSLEGMVSPMVIDQNLNYYENYINEQIRNGKSEQEVLKELGSPRLIARTIMDAMGETDEYTQSEVYEDDGQTQEESYDDGPHIFTLNSTKVKIGCVLSVIIAAFILYLLFHLFSAMMVVLGPVILIGLIVAMIMKILGK